jgi:hypothetical protein
MTHFEQALKKLIDDGNYRQAVIQDPQRLTNDFQQLDADEILLLMQAWLASGHPDAAASILTLCHCCTSHA